jgi:O-antigen/teichoic acid export membrane protein
MSYKSSGLLAGASFAGYVTLLALTPFITRVYGPVSIGEFAVLGSIILWLLPVLTLGNEVGILNANRQTDALRYLIRALTSILIVGSLAFAIGLTLALYPSGLLAKIPNWAFLSAPIIAVIASLSALLINYQIWQHKDRIVAGALYVNLGFRGALQLAAGLVSPSLVSLVVGELFGRLLAWRIADPKVLVLRLKILRRAVCRRAVAAAVTPYARYVTPKVLLENFVIWAPAFLIALLHGPLAAGLVSIAQRLGATPVTIFNQSFGSVLHRKLSRNEAPTRSSIVILLLIVSSVTGAMYVATDKILKVAGTRLFETVFGPAWGGLAEIIELLLPVYCVQFALVPLERILLQRKMLGLNLFASITNAIVLVLVFVAASAKTWTLEVTLHSLVVGLCASSVFWAFVSVASVLRGIGSRSLESHSG